jgi:hypothetical protein
MSSECLSESNYWHYENLHGSHPYPSMTDFYTDRYPSELYTFQHSVPADPVVTTAPLQRTAAGSLNLPAALSITRVANLPFLPVSRDDGALFGAGVSGTYPIQPHVSIPTSRSMKELYLNVFQVIHPSDAENTAQTTDLHVASDCKDGQDESQTHQPVPRKLVPQEIYKTARQQAGFRSSGVVEFVVNGKEGIRLSDALEGNWKGFEGRDDRSLFEDVRLQIILRLHVRSSARVPHWLR